MVEIKTLVDSAVATFTQADKTGRKHPNKALLKEAKAIMTKARLLSMSPLLLQDPTATGLDLKEAGEVDQKNEGVKQGSGDDSGSSSSDSSSEESEDDEAAKDKVSGLDEARKKWLEFIRAANDEAILSDRIGKIVNMLLDIFHEHKGDKVVIAAPFVKALDIIHEGIRRKAAKSSTTIKVAEHNETIRSPEERNQIIQRFNEPSDETEFHVLLLSTKKNRFFGLNLTGANHLMVSEPPTWPSVSARFVGAIRRIGQTKQSNVYNLVDSHSASDLLLKHIHDAKLGKSSLPMRYRGIQLFSTPPVTEFKSVMCKIE